MKKFVSVFLSFLMVMVTNVAFGSTELLPENIGFPGQIADFSAFGDGSVKVLKHIEFSETLDEVTLNENGGTMSLRKDSEGNGYINLYADSATKAASYFDVKAKEMAAEKLYVVDFRIRINELGDNASLSFYEGQDVVGRWRTGYSAVTNEKIISNEDGKLQMSYKKGEWTRISYCFNTISKELYVYKNGQFVGKEHVTSEVFPVFVRFELKNELGSVHNTDIDYVRIYTGSMLQGDAMFSGATGKIENVNVDFNDTKMDPPGSVSALMKNATVIMTSNNMLYLNGSKIPYDDETYAAKEINGEPMIPVNLLSKLTGSEAKYDEASNSVFAAGKSVAFTSRAVLQDGIWYMPLKEIAEPILGKKLTWDDRGCATLDEQVYEVQRDHYIDRHIQFHNSDLIYRFMQFDNPNGYEMIEKLKEMMPNKQHPRILFTMDDVEYILDKVNADLQWEKAYESLLASAKLELGKDNSSFYNPTTSSRQTDARALQDSLITLGEIYLLTGDTQYAVKAIEIMEALVKWDTLDYETSNLTAGHWMGAIAIGYDTFYNYLKSISGGEELLEKMRVSAHKLAMEPHYYSYNGDNYNPHWITIQDNFSGVIGGGMMMMLIAMGDEDGFTDEVAYLFENCLKTMGMTASLFYPNGGYYESVGYSEYCATNYSYALLAMKNTFNTYYGLEGAKGLDKLGYSMTFLQSPIACMNYHDGSSGYVLDPIREKWAYLFNDPNQAALAKRQKDLRGHKYSIEELFYYYRAVEGNEDRIDLKALGTDAYFYGAETGAFASSMDISTPNYVGFHGGLTNIPHDMLDLGQFIFDADGVRWAVDLGGDSYNIPGYFGEDGYKLYRKRPEGENCIVLNPRKDPGYYGQKLGARAELVLLDMNRPKGAMAAYDLSDAYERDAEKYVRGYYFGDDRNTLIVQDELKLKGNTELYWFMHTTHEIEILSNTQARLKSSNGKALLVDVYCSDPNYTLEVMQAVPIDASHTMDGEESNERFRKISIHAPNLTGNVTIAVKLSPENDGYDYTNLNVTPIEEWIIPEGDITPTPQLTTIAYNGTVSEQNIEGLREFTLVLPYGTTETPTISATANMGMVEIVKQPTTLDDDVVIKVSGAGMRTTNITVHLEVSQEKPIYVTEKIHDIDPLVNRVATGRVLPVAAYQKQVDDENNQADKLLDGDLNTRCAQNGENVWFELDYGKVYDAKGVALGFYLGDQRKVYMDILYSIDGVNYTRVYSGTSSGKTLDLELYEIPAQVRYVRIIANGTTEGNLWSSLTEAQLYQ